MKIKKLNRLSICLLLLAVGCSSGGGSSSGVALGVSWTDPVENEDGSLLTDLAGYNVYYGENPGDYSRVINVGNTSSYDIPSLRSGTTYYISVTAYDFSGNESGFSEELVATVP